MGRSALKDRYVNLPRRRSLRLMGINGISEDANIITPYLNFNGKKTSHSCIKAEVPYHEESTSSSIQDDCVIVAANSTSDNNPCKKESNYDTDEQNLQDISLKDLRAESKAKKRRVLESSPSKEGDVSSIIHLDQSPKRDPANVKPKEEEVDLEEPLIALKSKRSKISSSKRNTKRKRVQISSECSITPTTKDSASDLQYSKSAAADDKENIGAKRKLVLIKEEDSFLSSEHDLNRDVHSNSPDLVNHVKSEASEICSSTGVDVNTSSLSDINPLDSSSTELLQKVETGDSDCGESTCSANKPLDLCHHPAEPTYISPSSPELISTIEGNSVIVMHGNANHIASGSNDFIAKHSCTLNPSSDLIEISNGNLTSHGDITPNDHDYSTCCLNESSAAYVENDEYFRASEGAQDLLGETVNIEHNMAIKSISLEGGIHKNTINQLDQSFICLADINEGNKGDGPCISITVSENFKDDKFPLQELPLETEIRDVTVDPIFLCSEAQNFVDTSKFGAQDGRLESIVYDAINNYSQIKTSETTSSHIADGVAKGTWSTSTPQYSECFNTVKDSPTFNVSSPKADTALSSNVWQSANTRTAKTTYYAGDMYELDDDNRSTEALEVKSAQILQPCANLQDTDGGELSPSEAEEKQHNTVEQPISIRIYQEAKDEVSHMKKDITSDQILPEEHPPKKLLSNRKTISPTSQEKLCRAITDIYLCDGNEMPRTRKRLLLLSGSGEAQSLLHTDSTSKKPKTSRDSSLSPIPKGILKSRETSRTTASCMKSSSPDIDIEKAIEFSQSQMRGIENVAVKLLKGLKSMKNIVEDTVSSEAHSLISKYTVDEIKATTENATELERTTRRWLTIMTKDCNRFCKILRSAGNTGASPINGVHKGRRKITFADEAGGMLCHVKVFNQQPSSLDAPETEKAGS